MVLLKRTNGRKYLVFPKLCPLPSGKNFVLKLREKDEHKITSWSPENEGVNYLGDEDRLWKNAVKTFGLSLPAVSVIVRQTC